MGADTGSGDSCAQCGLQVYHAEAVATGREVQILQITVDNRYADMYNINFETYMIQLGRASLTPPHGTMGRRFPDGGLLRYRK